MSGKSVRDSWVDFSQRFLLEDLPDGQAADMEKAFYSGAAAMLGLLSRSPSLKKYLIKEVMAFGEAYEAKATKGGR